MNKWSRELRTTLTIHPFTAVIFVRRFSGTLNQCNNTATNMPTRIVPIYVKHVAKVSDATVHSKSIVVRIYPSIWRTNTNARFASRPSAPNQICKRTNASTVVWYKWLSSSDKFYLHFFSKRGSRFHLRAMWSWIRTERQLGKSHADTFSE